jgi:hypothetical protein
MKKSKNTNNNIENIHLRFKKIFNGLNDENWKLKLSLFLDEIILFDYKTVEERIVLGWLASICEKIYYLVSHKKDFEERVKFEKDFKEIVFSKKLPKFLTEVGPVLCGKRQPSFVESIDSTFERYRTMEDLGKVFNFGVEGIIIGGSMSYGPFYSVRNNIKDKDFSDIDGLVIVNDSFFNEKNRHEFLNNDIFQKNDNQLFFERMRVFERLFKERVVDVLSQRFSVNGKLYTVSLHFLHLSTFNKMTYLDLEKSLKERVDMDYILKDFRTDDFTHPCLARHTFNGERLESVVNNFKLKEGGYISYVPGYTISSGKLYPGVYHTVIYPSFLVFHDKKGKITDAIKKFKKIIYTEVEIMQKNFPFSAYSKAHNRYDIFAPGRYEEGLDSFINPSDFSKYLPPPDLEVTQLGHTNYTILNKESERENIENQENRIKIELELKKWKEEVLLATKSDIKKFLEDENFDFLLKSLKNQGNKWYTVCLIKAIKREIIKIPYPFYEKKKNVFVTSEIYTKIITVRDVLKLSEYEELSNKYGRVFVASIMDPGDEQKRYPIYYALIIRT